MLIRRRDPPDTRLWYYYALVPGYYPKGGSDKYSYSDDVGSAE
jgi:hypothetical protein